MKLSIFFALSAILIRMALFYFGFESTQSSRYIFILHILMILLSVFFAVLQFAKSHPEKLGLLSYLKEGLKGGLLYSVILTGFIMLFYGVLNKETFETKKEMLMEQQLESAVASNTSEANIEKAKTNMDEFFTVFNYSTISFLGFILISFLYALGVSAIFAFVPAIRKV